SAISLALALLWLSICAPTQVYAATFVVDRNDDDPSATTCTSAPNDCSLRGAVTRANTTGGANVITLPAGTYALSNGVLNITSFPTINGAGAATTIISGGNSSAIFTVPFSILSTGLTLNDVTLTLGY